MERDVIDIPLAPTTIVGVISDTHGLLRPEVPKLLTGVRLILHAGDVGAPEVLEALRTIAPVIAVRGNNDKGPWARRIPESQIVPIGSIVVYIVHDVKMMRLPSRKKVHVVVSGHSHRPSIDRREGMLFLNPGSTGPRRFKLPISMAKLIVEGEAVRAELVEL